jgi:hypothetical protein
VWSTALGIACTGIENNNIIYTFTVVITIIIIIIMLTFIREVYTTCIAVVSKTVLHTKTREHCSWSSVEKSGSGSARTRVHNI